MSDNEDFFWVDLSEEKPCIRTKHNDRVAWFLYESDAIEVAKILNIVSDLQDGINEIKGQV